jgi:DNA-binding NarL/FixJ family response regulator
VSENNRERNRLSSAFLPHEQRPELVIPPAWQRFLRSGEFSTARATVRAGAAEVPVDLRARVEFLDDHRLRIDLTLGDCDGDSLGSQELGSGEASPVRLLTPRERRVIVLIATGLGTPEIADALHVSSSTVRSHVRNAMVKLGAHTRAQLVAIAMAAPERVELTQSED